jgi:hypothetical protein
MESPKFKRVVCEFVAATIDGGWAIGTHLIAAGVSAWSHDAPPCVVLHNCSDRALLVGTLPAAFLT